MAFKHAVPDVAADPTSDVASGRATDASLVREVVGGSQEALAALYDRHANAVYAAAMRVSRDSWIAAEAAQETFLALWNRAELYDSTRGSLTAWLQRIARNRTVDHLRAAGRHHKAASFSMFATGTDDDPVDEWLTGFGELVAMSEPEPGPEVALSTKEARASIEDALATLAPHERSVIQLAYADGLSQSEIAERLGWPIGTVKTRTRRALRRLRDRIERPQAEPRAWSATMFASASQAASRAPCAAPCP
jgi:RNA polymerase sigma-70 factor (ECF subfamily)